MLTAFLAVLSPAENAVTMSNMSIVNSLIGLTQQVAAQFGITNKGPSRCDKVYKGPVRHQEYKSPVRHKTFIKGPIQHTQAQFGGLRYQWQLVHRYSLVQGNGQGSSKTESRRRATGQAVEMKLPDKFKVETKRRGGV